MSRKKILLIDDSNTVLMMEKMMLSGPYDLVVAHDGEEGVRKADTERPDLILLDVVMPKMDGVEACRRIRAQASTATIPIIMVTTRSEAANVEQCFRNGCNDYVNKPLNNAELLAKVRSILGSQQ